MLLTLQRTHGDNQRTFGALFADGVFCCYTLEDAEREKPGTPVAAWKQAGATAIPAGRYRVTLETSPRFGANTLTINGVPGFVGVRMHAGNTDADTEGCPLLGMAISTMGVVPGTSRPAVDLLRGVVSKALAKGDTVTIDVRRKLLVA